MYALVYWVSFLTNIELLDNTGQQWVRGCMKEKQMRGRVSKYTLLTVDNQVLIDSIY